MKAWLCLRNISNNEFNEVIIKSSNDILAALSNSHELMKSDVARYDALLTEHIHKSGINIAEAIEKEHARFVQKIASDANKIIAGVSEAITNEVAMQVNLVKDSMKELDDKLFIRACIMFVGCVAALFVCSILSSTWAARKVVGDTKVFRVSTVCNSASPAVTQKPKHR